MGTPVSLKTKILLLIQRKRQNLLRRNFLQNLRPEFELRRRFQEDVRIGGAA